MPYKDHKKKKKADREYAAKKRAKEKAQKKRTTPSDPRKREQLRPGKEITNPVSKKAKFNSVALNSGPKKIQVF